MWHPVRSGDFARAVIRACRSRAIHLSAAYEILWGPRKAVLLGRTRKQLDELHIAIVAEQE